MDDSFKFFCKVLNSASICVCAFSLSMWARAWMRSESELKLFCFKSFGINASFESEFFVAVGILHGYVVFADTVYLKARIPQGREYVFTVADDSVFDECAQVIMYRVLGIGAFVFVWLPAPADEPRSMQIGMVGSMDAGSRGIVRTCPAFRDVQQVAENIEGFLPAGRTGIERLSAPEFHARDDEMQFWMPSVSVPHPENIPLVFLQSGKGYCLETVHDLSFLLRRDDIVGMPGKDASRELPCRVQRVDEPPGKGDIPSQNLRRTFLSAGVIHPHKVMRGRVTSAFPVRKHLHVHGSFSSS